MWDLDIPLPPHYLCSLFVADSPHTPGLQWFEHLWCQWFQTCGTLPPPRALPTPPHTAPAPPQHFPTHAYTLPHHTPHTFQHHHTHTPLYPTHTHTPACTSHTCHTACTLPHLPHCPSACLFTIPALYHTYPFSTFGFWFCLLHRYHGLHHCHRALYILFIQFPTPPPHPAAYTPPWLRRNSWTVAVALFFHFTTAAPGVSIFYTDSANMYATTARDMATAQRRGATSSRTLIGATIPAYKTHLRSKLLPALLPTACSRTALAYPSAAART